MKKGRNRISLLGRVFTRLKVVGTAPDTYSSNGRARSRWHCICSCGEPLLVKSEQLMAGKAKSCGCLNRELSAKRWITHGLSHAGLRAYTAWAKMRERVLCKTNKAYKYYGGRGIRICQRWHDFKEFYADMGDPPKGMTLHRKNNDGNYTPLNCIWADKFTQAQGKSTNVNWTHNGETHCIAVWERKLGTKKGVLRSRHLAGWDVKRILTTPTP